MSAKVAIPGNLTAIGLNPNVELGDFEALVEVGRTARRLGDGFQWYMGDLALRVEVRYGEQDLMKWCESVEINYNTARAYRAVAKAYEFGTRLPDLTWTHHRHARKEGDRLALLELAEREKWSSRELELHIKQRKRDEKERKDKDDKPPPDPPIDEKAVFVVWVPKDDAWAEEERLRKLGWMYERITSDGAGAASTSIDPRGIWSGMFPYGDVRKSKVGYDLQPGYIATDS